jgi:hypothetical protein
MGGIFKNDDDEEEEEGCTLLGVDVPGESLPPFLKVELLSLPFPLRTARALSSDDLATSRDPRCAVADDRSSEALLLGPASGDETSTADEDDSPVVSACDDGRRLCLDSLASFLAFAFASFSSFLRRSSSSSMDRRIASMTMSSSRLREGYIKSDKGFEKALIITEVADSLSTK